MGKWIAVTVALAALAAWDGVLGARIAGAYGAARAVQLRLDEANDKIEALEKTVGELYDAKSLDEKRIGAVEAAVCHDPTCSH